MSDDDRIPDLLGSWYEDREKGDSRARKEILRAHPDLADDLREHFDAMDAIVRSFSGSESGEETGREFGDYRIIRELGRGGMGVVYEAEQISLRRTVALKILSIAYAASGKALKRFQREAQAAARLHHTNIVPVYSMGEHGGFWFYAMELVEGRPLSEIITGMRGLDRQATETSSVSGADAPADGTPPSKGSSSDLPGTDSGERSYYVRIAEMFADVADALHLAHEGGILHRDVKPANLLLEDGGTLKIVDFGLARLEGDEPALTLTGDLLGTPVYMSPEQAMAKRIDIDHRTDVYSLGATLYEVLTLRPPFKGENLQEICSQVITKDPALPRRADSRIPRDLETVVLKAMAKERDKRYASARALARDLRRFAEGAAIRARRIGPAGRAWRKIKCQKVRSLLAATVVILVAAGAFLAWRAAHEAERRREVEYARLCTSGETALAHSMTRVLATSFDNAMKPGETARDIFSRAISLDPDRSEAYWLRASAPGRTVEERLADVEAAYARGGLSLRSYHLARADLLRHDGRRQEAGEAQQLASASGPATCSDRFVEGTLLVRAGRRGEAQEELTAALEDPALPTAVRYRALSWRSHLHLQNREWAKSLEDFLAMRALGDDSCHVRLHLVVLWRALGQEEAAESLLQETLRNLEGDEKADAWLTYGGYLLSRLPRLEEALEAGDRAVELDPEFGRAWALRGVCLGGLNRHEEAIRSCERALELAPDDPFVLVGCGRALSLAGRATKAVESLSRCIELDPSNAIAHLNYGMALSDAGRYPESLAACGDALRLDPNLAVVRYYRVYVLGRMNRCSEALAAYEEAATFAPPTARNVFLLGYALLRLGRMEDAFRAFDKASRMDPPYPGAIACKGRILEDQNRFAEALRCYDRVIELEPGDGHNHASRGQVLTKMGRLEEALEACDRGVELAPGLASCHNLRGNTLQEMRRYEEALEAYDRAIQISPEDAKLHSNRGIVLNALRRHGDALGACDRAIALDPERSIAHYERGQALNSLGRLEDALEAYDRSLDLDNAYARCHNNRGNLLLNAGRLEEALLAFDRAIALEPENALQHTNRGTCLRRLRRYEEALEAHDRAIALEPDQAFFHRNRGAVLVWLGRHEDALSAYDRVVALEPEQAVHHANRGECLSRLRRIEEALRAFERAVALEPDVGPYHANRGWLLLRGRRVDDAIEALERARILGHAHPGFLNLYAWLCATAADPKHRDPEKAVEMARRAARLVPKDWRIWNTLGVAYCRSGRWQEGLDALEKSMEIQSGGGTACDWFFVAMAHAKLGRSKDTARGFYDRAVAWMEKHAPDDEELTRFRAESEGVLGISRER